jgi:hypothetical protein
MINEKPAIIKWIRWQKGEEQLQYWSFPYGATLGAPFAAIQPHRVKRLINDGVYNAKTMFSGLWTTSLNDFGRVIDSFFTYCFQAGVNHAHFTILADLRLCAKSLTKLLLN